jgi:hypothetical protein
MVQKGGAAAALADIDTLAETGVSRAKLHVQAVDPDRAR